MHEKSGIDRDKHDVDVLEQVFRGVHTDPFAAENVADVVDLKLKPVVGDARSAVQMPVLEVDSDHSSDE